MAGGKLWGGRFTGQTDPLAEAFNASISVDQVLLEEDVAGSIAHSRMLALIGVLTEEEQQCIEKGLLQVKDQFLADPALFSEVHEDIHMNVEQALTAAIGDLGKKLHTARSRNDQVALDFRLYVMKQNKALRAACLQLMQVLIEQAEAHANDLMPGYTHLQRAQPVTLGFHLLTYVAMLSRDVARLDEQYPRISSMPLGSGAMAGLPYPSDRVFLQEALGFESIALHAMDAVSDRDFAVEFLATGALIQTHLSRLAEELILWSSMEFGFIRLHDAYCTGSSIMPQKRNPDVAELIRGKSGRVYGNLLNLLTTLKALPLAYNKDMQEDKAPVIDTASQLLNALTLMARMIDTAVFQTEKMAQAVAAGFLNATDLADYLVSKGLPFRMAHEVSGKAVAMAERAGQTLGDLSLETYQSLVAEVQGLQSVLVDEGLYQAIDLNYSIAQKKSPGSTAPESVAQMLAYYRALIEEKMN